MSKITRDLFWPVSGTVLEYYDYALFGFLAPQLSAHFFPASEPGSAILKTYLIFASAYLAKILGAVYFGRLADHRGRALSLKRNFYGMALPTLLIGLLPGYQQIGILAPIALCMLRVAQGFSIGGEYDTVTVLVFERVGEKKPCFANGFLCLATSLGVALAASVAQLTPHPSNSWRLSFIIGGALSFILLKGRQRIQESSAFTRHSSQAPVLSYRTEAYKLLMTVIVCGTLGASFQFYFVFLPHSASMVAYLPTPYPYGTHILIFCLMSLPAGLLADRLQPRWAMRLASVALIIIACLIVSETLNTELIKYLLILNAGLLPFLHVPAGVFLLQHFRLKERCQILSLGHALGSALFSGSLPALGLFLVHWTNHPSSAWAYLISLYLFCFSFLMGRKTNV